MKKAEHQEELLASVKPSTAMVRLAIPATLALLAKAVYNIVDTAYIGMLGSDTALAAVGVTLPLLRAFGASDAVLPQAKDYAFWMFIAAYGVVQRLILIGCYVVMGFMQGYQPIASYAFGARNEERFHESVRFAFKGALVLTLLVAAAYILLAGQLILLFNRNPLVVEYGRMLLISQVALYPAFGLCYMMTITFQTIGSAKMGLLLSMIRQDIFYLPFILTLPGLMGVKGIYLSQPAADVLTILMCLLLIRPMKQIASRNMGTA